MDVIPSWMMAEKKNRKPPGSAADTAMPEKDHAPKVAEPAEFPVVGIGASAGGLEALEQFFSAVPPRSGMAFVVIQHLDPTHPSAMASLLKRHTAMPVAEAEERAVEPDHVYVMPPTKIVSLAGRTLRLRERADQSDLGLSVDVFFHSLATELKESAVGVILSGTGRDGTLGAKAIKSELGMVMVQDPVSARYDGMPRAAISAGVADFILAPHEMPARLIEYMSQSQGFQATERRDTMEKEASDLQRIFSIIRLRTRRDFSGYKVTTLKRRIERRLSVNRVDSLGDYAQLLNENAGEADALFKDLLINVTSFFRDEVAFAVLKENLLEHLGGKKDGDTVRAWTVGCSTGEEAYSLAILLQECIDQLGRYLEVQVFGTDIDSDAIAVARAGIYPASIVQDLSEERLKRFFVRKDNQFQIKKEVREKLVFAVQDITVDPPFSRMDLISVRNVLIYLGGELQRRLIPVLHYALEREGILFLGTAENIGEYAGYFNALDRKWKIYRKKGSSDLRIPLPPHTTWRDVGIPPLPGSPEAAPLFSSERALLQALGPSVLVDSLFHIVYVHGETSRFLELGQGEPSNERHGDGTQRASKRAVFRAPGGERPEEDGDPGRDHDTPRRRRLHGAPGRPARHRSQRAPGFCGGELPRVHCRPGAACRGRHGERRRALPSSRRGAAVHP